MGGFFFDFIFYFYRMKILVLRFSSIGDIVLTTPLLRCIKEQIPGVELHYLTKQKFHSLLETNPHLDKIYTFQKSYQEVLTELKAEKYDHIVDLHHNIRSLGLKLKLKTKTTTFRKLNIQKWMLVKFKLRKMPKIHVVDRYFEALSVLKVQNDGLPGEFYLNPEDNVSLSELIQGDRFVAFALGAQFATKRMPLSKMIEVLDQINLPLVLLGDQNDAPVAEKLCQHFPEKQLIQACGKYSLRQSASIVQQAAVILTHDTGLMHIAACFQKPIVSVWGNTVPELGMYPYLPNHPFLFSIHECKPLSCRPCSKIGFKTCPKGHFACMNQQDAKAIATSVKKKAIQS